VIISGHLKPKQRLYELEISKATNVSRALIREVLSSLEKERFVKIFPRKGIIISDINWFRNFEYDKISVNQ